MASPRKETASSKSDVKKRTRSEARGKDDSDISSLTSSFSSVSISPEDGQSPESNRLPSTSSHVDTKPSTRKKERQEGKRPESSQSASRQPGPSRDKHPDQNLTQKIKFLINVPMWVPLPDQNHPKEFIMSQCQRLLTLLENTGFSGEDQEHLRDVAIVIGLNGKGSKDEREIRKLLVELAELKEKTCLRFEKVIYTWGPEGDIKYTPTVDFPIPYQDIREYLKNHDKTKKLVRELRGTEQCLIYFSW